MKRMSVATESVFVVLYNVFTPTRSEVDFSKRGSNKERKDRCVAVVDKHTLDDAKTITMMKSKHRYMVLVRMAVLFRMLSFGVRSCRIISIFWIWIRISFMLQRDTDYSKLFENVS